MLAIRAVKAVIVRKAIGAALHMPASWIELLVFWRTSLGNRHSRKMKTLNIDTKRTIEKMYMIVASTPRPLNWYGRLCMMTAKDDVFMTNVNQMALKFCRALRHVDFLWTSLLGDAARFCSASAPSDDWEVDGSSKGVPRSIKRQYSRYNSG